MFKVILGVRDGERKLVLNSNSSYLSYRLGYRSHRICQRYAYKKMIHRWKNSTKDAVCGVKYGCVFRAYR